MEASRSVVSDARDAGLTDRALLDQEVTQMAQAIDREFLDSLEQGPHLETVATFGGQPVAAVVLSDLELDNMAVARMLQYYTRGDLSLARVVKAAERMAIRHALHLTGGNRRKAAALLGISLRTIFYKLSHLEES